MGYSRNFDGRKVLFIEVTVIGWNPSKGYFMLVDYPAEKFDFIWQEPVSRVKI